MERNVFIKKKKEMFEKTKAKRQGKRKGTLYSYAKLLASNKYFVVVVGSK